MRTRRTTRLAFQPPAIGDEEIAAVAEALRSGWLTTGSESRRKLERRMSEYLEAEHVLASLVHRRDAPGALAVGVGPGDEVITSPDRPSGDGDVSEHCGRDPGPRRRARSDLNLDPTSCRSGHRATRAIFPCTSPGSRGASPRCTGSSAGRRGRRARDRGPVSRAEAGGRFDATGFSLYATKNLAAARAGLSRRTAATSQNGSVRCRLTRRGDGAHYDQVSPGFKANLSDVLAAIALVQLDRLDYHSAIRARQFSLYDEGLAGIYGITPLALDPRDHPRPAISTSSGSMPTERRE